MPSLLIPRAVLDAVGPFHDDLRRYEDAELMGRISERYPLGFIQEPLVVYRLAVDRLHLTGDDSLRAGEARRYVALYRARRPVGVQTPEEATAVSRFEEDLAALEARLARAGAPPMADG